MSDVDQDQKSEQATEKRLSEAHERGQFAKSPELQVFILIAATLCVFTFTMQTSSRDIAEYASAMFTRFAVTTVEVHPVHAIDGVSLSPAPGPLTTAVAERVRATIAAAVAP